MGFLEKRIEELEEETHGSVWPLGEQLLAVLDIIKVRTWPQPWPIRYNADRDFPGPVSSPYPATDRELRLLGGLCRCYAEERVVVRGEDEALGNVIDYVRDYIAEDKPIEECMADFTEHARALVTRMDPGKQPHREEQLYKLWKELAQ